MVYESPTPYTVFSAGDGFWVYEIRGVVALSYTDSQERALRFATSDADKWLPFLQSMATCKIERVDLPQDNRAAASGP